MNENRISTFLLERYHIGEVTNEEKLQVEKAVASDETLAAALADLDRADSDFRLKFPQEKIFPVRKIFRRSDTRRVDARYLHKVPPFVWGVCAAAVVLVIALPLFVLKKPANAEFGERIKGALTDESSIELNVYLRGNSAGGGIKLPDQAGVKTGDTVQLAYRVSGDNSVEKYGVIFSVDGRSSVTLHYPYSQTQSTRLVSGKPVALEEAYTLDDAPEYEIFFFVAGNTPIEARNILNTARQLAIQIAHNPQDALYSGSGAFKDYEVNVLTLRKE